MSQEAAARQVEIDRLRARRSKNRFVRLSVLALLALAVYAWGWGDLEIDHLFRARTAKNLDRFLTEVLVRRWIEMRPMSASGTSLTPRRIQQFRSTIFSV